MGKQELDNLVRIERLKVEPPTHSEYAGMVPLLPAHSEYAGMVPLLPADVSSTRRTTTWTPTASSISPTAPPTGWRSPPCAAKAIVPQTASRYSKHSCIRWGSIARISRRFSRRITSETWPNTRAAWISTQSFWLTCCARQRRWRWKSPNCHHPQRIEPASRWSLSTAC